MSVRVQNDIFRRHTFSNAVNNSIININIWFISNLLSLNIEKYSISSLPNEKY